MKDSKQLEVLVKTESVKLARLELTQMQMMIVLVRTVVLELIKTQARKACVLPVLQDTLALQEAEVQVSAVKDHMQRKVKKTVQLAQLELTQVL